MREYICISCGATRESEQICSCSECGYRMFEMPYDRKAVLVSEICNFLSALQIKKIKRTDLIFDGKDKDDNRFPDYDKIVKYVTGQDKTEGFIRNLLETTKQLKLHFSESASHTYSVSYAQVDSLIKKYDAVLSSVAGIFSADYVPVFPDTIALGKTSLLYTKQPNNSLGASANELLALIEKLAEKTVKFIKINNLYGNSHKYHPNKSHKSAKNIDFNHEFDKAVTETQAILEKRYVVDITEDGSRELRQMLDCIWGDIELIMSAPLFTEKYTFIVNSEKMDETSYSEYISSVLSAHYADYNHNVNAAVFLENKTENETFEIYKKCIEQDVFGILIPVGTTLVNIGEGEKKLDELIGLTEIKDSVKKIKSYALANKDSDNLNIHMCFMGNPGSGKTEVARYIAEILYENKILPTRKIVEVDRSGLVSQYFGATAEKTRSVIDSAMGGVLFIDEAYALCNQGGSGTSDYGKEAIDTLVKAMEDRRGEFCVILAGYKNEMLQMLSVNPGFKSRIQFMLDFPNYTRTELQKITDLMLKKRGYTIGEQAVSRILDITDVKRIEPNFANAREVRNILDQVIMCQNMRCAGTDDKELGLVDVNQYITDAKINLPVFDEKGSNRILSGEEELDRLVGLEQIKRTIKKIKAYAKRNKGADGFNLHMCFCGNPGTGKTEVARILSRILYEACVLSEAKLIETDGLGLLGKYVGETAPKTEAKIKEAMNGVLFIDEAYALTGTNGTTNYGDEAIAVLIKNMEDYRGQFCVILAGYQNEMTDMLHANPGFESRIQFVLNFPDYSREELGEIAKLILAGKKYRIEDSALQLLLDVSDYYRNQPNFANARTLRNILEQVIMNQNLRVENEEENDMIIYSDVNDYIIDEKINMTETRGRRQIGF